MRDAILEASAYVLKKEGPLGFTTNKVADKAGVSIASLYQYYRNKESLFFHMAELEWETSLQKLAPILEDKNLSKRDRLKKFIQVFFETEAEESELRTALRAAAISIEETKQFKALYARFTKVIHEFIEDSLPQHPKEDLSTKVEFITCLISSTADRLTSDKISPAKLQEHATLLSTMIISYFKI